MLLILVWQLLTSEVRFWLSMISLVHYFCLSLRIRSYLDTLEEVEPFSSHVKPVYGIRMFSLLLARSQRSRELNTYDWLTDGL